MSLVASLVAAMTISGAFWIGVLAARRLREWGDRRLGEGTAVPLALAAGSSTSGAARLQDASARRIRAVLAERIDSSLERHAALPEQRNLVDGMTLDHLAVSDIVSVESVGARGGADYVVQGVMALRDGATTTTLAVMLDHHDERWLIGQADSSRWLLLEPVRDHGIVGEPPRVLDLARGSYTLEKRSHSVAAGIGAHGRGTSSRVACYLFRASDGEVAWVERWGTTVFVGVGSERPSHEFSFLPGSPQRS